MKNLVTLLISSTLVSGIFMGNAIGTTNSPQENIKADIQDIKDNIKDAASDTKDTISDKIQDAKDSIKDSLSSAQDAIKDAFKGKLEITDAIINYNNSGNDSSLNFSIKNNTDKDITITNITSDSASSVTYKNMKLNNIVIPAKQTMNFNSAANNISLLNIRRDVKDGDRVNLVVFTKEIGSQTIPVIVKR